MVFEVYDWRRINPDWDSYHESLSLAEDFCLPSLQRSKKFDSKEQIVDDKLFAAVVWPGYAYLIMSKRIQCEYTLTAHACEHISNFHLTHTVLSILLPHSRSQQAQGLSKAKQYYWLWAKWDPSKCQTPYLLAVWPAIEENTISSCSKLYSVQNLQRLNMASWFFTCQRITSIIQWSSNNKWRALNLLKKQ